MPAISGHRGRVVVKGFAFKVHRWALSIVSQEDDISYAAGDRAKRFVPGLEDASCELEAYLDPDEDPFDSSTFSLRNGETTSLTLYPDVSTYPLYRFSWDTWLWLTVDVRGEIRAPVSFTATGKATSETQILSS